MELWLSTGSSLPSCKIKTDPDFRADPFDRSEAKGPQCWSLSGTIRGRPPTAAKTCWELELLVLLVIFAERPTFLVDITDLLCSRLIPNWGRSKRFLSWEVLLILPLLASSKSWEDRLSSKQSVHHDFWEIRQSSSPRKKWNMRNRTKQLRRLRFSRLANLKHISQTHDKTRNY